MSFFYNIEIKRVSKPITAFNDKLKKYLSFINISYLSKFFITTKGRIKNDGLFSVKKPVGEDSVDIRNQDQYMLFEVLINIIFILLIFMRITTYRHVM